MGTTTSSRRISLDNTLTLKPSLGATVEKSIEEETSLLDLDTIKKIEFSSDLSKESVKSIEISKENVELSYWAHRIEELKNEHQMINSIVETQFTKTLENTNKICPPQVITHERLQRVKPCFEWRSKITKCYEDNPHQTLICSDMVQAFSKCVTSCKTHSE